MPTQFFSVDKDHASTLTGSGTLVKKGNGRAHLHLHSSDFTGTLQVDEGWLGLGLSNHVLVGNSSKNAVWNLVGGTTYFEHPRPTSTMVWEVRSTRSNERKTGRTVRVFTQPKLLA